MPPVGRLESGVEVMSGCPSVGMNDDFLRPSGAVVQGFVYLKVFGVDFGTACARALSKK